MNEHITLDARRKRARFRAWHRGMKEMDMILGAFADAKVDELTLEELLTFEELMDVLDRDLFKWFTGEGATPDAYNTPLFQSICKFHKIDLP